MAVISDKTHEIPRPVVPSKPEMMGFHFIPSKPVTRNITSGIIGIRIV
jgi:hypothetical protein